MKQYAYGVDIGGTTVKIGFFETTGKLVDTWEIPTRTENSGELILPDIAASIKENNEKHGIEMGDIEGVGMGVPGPIKDDGTVLKCVNLGCCLFCQSRYKIIFSHAVLLPVIDTTKRQPHTLHDCLSLTSHYIPILLYQS